jgi:hypothetical protein
MKTDWEGPLDAAVPPVCVEALAAHPSQGRLEEAQHCQHRRQLNSVIRFGS